MAYNMSPTTAATYGILVTGIWLIIAPFVLVYIDAAAITNDIVVGIILISLVLIRLFSSFRPNWINWANIILGFWLIIAPFVLGYTFATSQWNDIILGIVVVVLGAWSAVLKPTRPRL